MNIKTLILIMIAVIAVLITFGFVEPLSQDPGYHDFADQRTFWQIPNTFDVLSNIPLAIVGLLGIVTPGKRLRHKSFNASLFQYLIFLMYKFPENYLPYLIGLMISYGLSRLTEFLDYQIYTKFQFISGHTLKHLFAAAAAFCICIMLINREDLQI
jgi:hypothetical protein